MRLPIIGLVMAAALVCGGAAKKDADAPPATFILNGYRLSGVPGVNGDDITSKLAHKEGDRMTSAAVSADAETVGAAIKARQIEGQLLTTLAERDGKVWVLWDFEPKYPARPLAPGVTRRFESQSFTGNTTLSSAALAAATGLKAGDALPDPRIDAAREGVAAAYRKAMPNSDIHVATKMRVRPDGAVLFIWTIQEPKA